MKSVTDIMGERSLEREVASWRELCGDEVADAWLESEKTLAVARAELSKRRRAAGALRRAERELDVALRRYHEAGDRLEKAQGDHEKASEQFQRAMANFKAQKSAEGV